uniref:Uncharacterized protein n=1 Tax=Anguilla anguilla TaxID=7936 RepID=A0A0E9SZ65_ANGAN
MISRWRSPSSDVIKDVLHWANGISVESGVTLKNEKENRTAFV